MLDECIQEFMFKPESQRCLYEIRIASQPPLVTELLNVEQIAELARRKATSLRDTIAFGIVIAAGFAGAENVIYLFRYSHDVESLLLLGTLTANPMHLATGVIASYFIHSAIEDEQRSHYLAVAILLATALHGAYDYLLLSSRGRSYAFVFVLCFVVALGSAHNPKEPSGLKHSCVASKYKIVR